LTKTEAEKVLEAKKETGPLSVKEEELIDEVDEDDVSEISEISLEPDNEDKSEE